MAKKRAAESDAEHSDTPPKRARVDAQNTAKAKGKGKATKKVRKSTPVQDSSDDESVVEIPPPPVEDDSGEINVGATQTDADFERIHKDKVKENLQRKQNRTGAAEAGVISAVELINFMCHKRLTFKFGPQVNFIIGQNGSGKSASLSAITVALGGKATSTGRGSGLKSFIMSGETAAEVSVTLKNGGHEAYKPEVYGDSIIISRGFTQAGSTSFKIKTSQGKLVSGKRDELAAILDHYLIDVDNPMNILTQDLARQFLSSSNPTEKYNLFLKGTLLTQLQEEYDEILENTNKTKAVLTQKNVIVEELSTTYHEAESRYQKAKNLQEAEGAISKLKGELAWAHLAEQEKILSDAIVKTNQAEEKVERVKELIVEAATKVAEAEEKINEVETRAAQAASPQELTDQLAGLNQQVAEGKQKLVDARRDLKAIGEEIKKENRSLTKTEAEIAEGNAKLARDSERERIRTKIEEAERAHKAAKEKHEDLTIESNRAKEASEAYHRELATIEREFSELQRRITDVEGRRNHFRDQAKGKGGAGLYGNRMPQVLDLIKRERWVGEKPVGPLGMHVKLREKKWAHVLRVGIGNLLGGFAVTNNQDKITLRRILDDNGFHRTAVIIGQPDIFDYSGGEPPSGILTALRALQVDNEWVTRIMINSNKIERVILAESRGHAERLLNEHPRYTVWTADGLRVQRFNDGGGQTAPLGRIGGHQDFRNFLFTEGNHQEELEDAERKLQELASSFEDVARRKREAAKRVSDAERDSIAAMRAAHQALAAAKTTHKVLAAAEAEDVQEKPIDLAVLEDSAENARDRIADLSRQLAGARESCDHLDRQIRPLVEQAAAIRRQVDGFKERQAEIKLEVDEAVSELLTVKESEKHYRRKLDEEQANVQRLQREQSRLETEYTEWRARVEPRYEEIKEPRPRKVLERELEKKQKAHEKSVEEQGQTMAEILAELERARAAWLKAKNEFAQMNQLVQALRHSLATRMQKWQFFRQYMTLRTKLQFQLYLSSRGFYGQIHIKHSTRITNGELTLRVQTDDQKGRDGKAHEKDVKMSGGEKSFATICLLLSLWDAMGCPVRALDEFDVYMDAINRRISMKMMLDAAKNSDKQHILITPQDMGNVVIGPEIKIIRMNNPERGQQTLAF